MTYPVGTNSDITKAYRFGEHGYGDTRCFISYQNLFYPFEQGGAHRHHVHIYRVGIHVHKGQMIEVEVIK